MLKTRETRVEERKEEKRSEKRDRILRAAEAIFLDKGFHAASMNEIAEAADVSTPHLYNFYASKAALALAVQLKMGQETFDALKTAMSAGKKNPSCESIFDSRRSSLMLTILTECTRNPDIKEKITENGARLRAMISEAGGISQDDQEGQYRILCVMAMYLGMSISNIGQGSFRSRPRMPIAFLNMPNSKPIRLVMPVKNGAAFQACSISADFGRKLRL